MKIALVLDTMSVGGIPKAAIPLMDELSKYAEVTLILTNTTGELQSMIPDSVRVLCFRQQNKNDALKYLLRTHRYGKAVGFALKHIWHSRFSKRYVKSRTNISRSLPYLLDEAFDCAISYHGMNILTLSRTLYQINARKKVAWIHGDHPFEGVHKRDAHRLYQCFSKIYCVSQATKQKFIYDFPHVTDITDVLYNIFNVAEIKQKAEAFTPFVHQDAVNIVTVGRISPEKGQLMIPDIAKQLVNNGYRIKWYVVGDGTGYVKLENKIQEQQLSAYITLVGALTNPYPYINACDIYVQPSYTEGYPLTIFEAAILHKPIVATNVGGTKESFQNNSILLTDVSSEALCDGIMKLLNDPHARKTMSAELETRDFSNSSEVSKLVDWLASEI